MPLRARRATTLPGRRGLSLCMYWSNGNLDSSILHLSQLPQEAMSERARQLLPSRLGKDQVAVFGLGDGARAMTLTANGNAVRSAERGGMNLEALVHRPVWLAGR